MRHLHNLQNQIAPAVMAYIAILEEGFADINRFLDTQLESDAISNAIIVGIIATPFIGLLLFISVVMLSA